MLPASVPPALSAGAHGPSCPRCPALAAASGAPDHAPPSRDVLPLSSWPVLPRLLSRRRPHIGIRSSSLLLWFLSSRSAGHVLTASDCRSPSLRLLLVLWLSSVEICLSVIIIFLSVTCLSALHTGDLDTFSPPTCHFRLSPLPSLMTYACHLCPGQGRSLTNTSPSLPSPPPGAFSSTVMPVVAYADLTTSAPGG